MEKKVGLFVMVHLPTPLQVSKDVQVVFSCSLIIPRHAFPLW